MDMAILAMKITTILVKVPAITALVFALMGFSPASSDTISAFYSSGNTDVLGQFLPFGITRADFSYNGEQLELLSLTHIAPLAQATNDITIDPVNEKVYWLQRTPGSASIRRSNYDGTGVEDFLLSAGTSGIFFDPAGKQLYYDLGVTDPTPGFGSLDDKFQRIYRVSSDGTGSEIAFTVPITSSRGDIAVRKYVVDANVGKAFVTMNNFQFAPNSLLPRIIEVDLDDGSQSVFSSRINHSALGIDTVNKDLVYSGNDVSSGIARRSYGGNTSIIWPGNSLLNGIADVAYEPESGLYFVTGGSSGPFTVWRQDTSTGQPELVLSGSAFGLQSTSPIVVVNTSTPIPEPSTVLLLCTGAVGAILRRRPI